MEHITSQQPDKKFHQTYIHKVVAFLVNICVVHTYVHCNVYGFGYHGYEHTVQPFRLSLTFVTYLLNPLRLGL